MVCLDECREFGLERFDLPPEDKPATREDPIDRGGEGRANLFSRGGEVQKRDHQASRAARMNSA